MPPSAYRVGVLDVLRARTSNEEESRRQTTVVFGAALVTCHVLDVLAAVGLCVAHADGKAAAVWRPLTHAQLGFHDEAVDLVVLAVGRAVLIPVLTLLAIRFGSEIPRKKKATSPRDSADGYELLREEINNNNAGREASSAALDGANKAFKARAIRRKHLLLTLVFVTSTASQIYVGLKVNAFDWDLKTAGRPRWLKAAQVVLMCVSVLLTNAAAFVARELVKELTRESSLFLKDVHAHPLVFDASICRHWCNLCSTPIRTGGAWRCKLCDFDMCVPCASRRDAATVGENVLRTDRGARVEKSVSSVAYLRRAIHLAAKKRGLLAGAMALLAANSFLALLMPKYQGKIIDRVVEGRRGAFQTAVQAYLLIMLLQGLCRAGYSSVFSIVSRTILFSVRTKLFKAVVRQDVAFFDGTTSGHLTSRLTNDANTMMAPIDSSLSSLLYNGIMLVGGVVMCFSTSYALSMLAFVVVGPIMYLWDLYGTWSKNLSRRVLAQWAEANSIATECLAHIRTVKSFVCEAIEGARYDAASSEALRLGIRDSIGFGLTSALTGYLDLGTGVLILWYGGLIVLRNKNHPESSEGLSIGDLVTFQLYWNMMNAAYQNLQGLVTSFTRSAAAAEKVFALMDSLPDIGGGDDGDGDPIVDLGRVQGALALEAVEFHYIMRPDAQVLKGVTLKIAPKTVCALVGRSGGGKSTIISLLMRFYDPRRGAVTLDGVDVRTLRVADYRRLFGIVAQDTPLFARSIEQNIAYGLFDVDAAPGDDHETIDSAAVELAAREACAHDFIAAMKDGYKTRVGERGSRLSGGQRQRIAIARIFLRQPRIVLLDEATSALDEDSQHAVQQSLDRLIQRGDSTVVLVAHRLSTVMNADNIAVVDDGRVVEQGTHEDLLHQPNGVYASLVKRQLAKAASTLDQAHDEDGPEKQAQNDTIDKLLDDLAAKKAK